MFGAIITTWLSAADAPLGEEAVVLPHENNPLSGGTGLRVGVSSAGKDIFQYMEIHKFSLLSVFLTFIWDIEYEV